MKFLYSHSYNCCYNSNHKHHSSVLSNQNYILRNKFHYNCYCNHSCRQPNNHYKVLLFHLRLQNFHFGSSLPLAEKSLYSRSHMMTYSLNSILPYSNFGMCHYNHVHSLRYSLFCMILSNLQNTLLRRALHMYQYKYNCMFPCKTYYNRPDMLQNRQTHMSSHSIVVSWLFQQMLL